MGDEAAPPPLALRTAGIGRWRSFAAMLAVCSTTLLDACTTSQPASESASFEPLAHTQWALNAIKAGVAEQGTVRIADPGSSPGALVRMAKQASSWTATEA